MIYECTSVVEKTGNSSGLQHPVVSDASQNMHRGVTGTCCKTGNIHISEIFIHKTLY